MNATELRAKVCDLVAFREEKLKRKQINAVLDVLAEVVKDELGKQNTKVCLLGVGSLYSEEVRPRKYFDPRPGVCAFGVSDARRRVRFSPSEELKRKLEKGMAA